MKLNRQMSCAAAVLAACVWAGAVRAEDYQLLKAKAEILVGQAGELYQESCRKGSEIHDAPYQYYFGLMHATGTNLLARSESTTTTLRMRKYLDLIGKDYDAYTKISAATDMASATGNGRGNAGGRHRAKRLINAEKLRDKELAAAIKRWEDFAVQLKKDKPK